MTGEFTQTEIARMVGLDKTTMVVTVDELEAAGLAERRPSATDRRARVIVVTDAGATVVREADEVLDRVRDDVLSVLEPDERQVFLRRSARSRAAVWPSPRSVRAAAAPARLTRPDLS